METIFPCKVDFAILPSFVTDGGGFTVTGEDFGLGRKGHQLLQRANQLTIVTARKVGATVAATEECVAGEQLPLFRKIQTYRSLRMSRRMYYLTSEF